MNDQMSGGAMGGNNVCKCHHHKVVPIAIILIGLDVVLQTLGVVSGTWPMMLIGVFLIVIGVMKLSGRNCKCCARA